MNHNHQHRSLERLNKLMEPLVDFIAATDNPRLALDIAMILLINRVEYINVSATRYIEHFGEPTRADENTI